MGHHKNKHKSKDRSARHEAPSASSDDGGFDLSAATQAITAALEAAQEVAVEEGIVPGAEEDNYPVQGDDGEDGGDDNYQGTVEAVVQGNFYIHAKKCLQCTHLCPTTGKKAYSDCHYTKGNENCPASETRIVIMLPYQTIATRLYKAHMESDVATMASLMARLNRQDAEEVEKVLAAYKSMLNDN